MARIRTIKPEFWSDSKTGTLSGNATKLLIGMLNFSDDYGVIEYDIPMLKVKIFPYEKSTSTKCVSKPLIDELLPKGLVVLFKWDNDTKPYLLIRNFNRHQKVDRPSQPLIDGFNLKDLQKSINNCQDSPSTRRVLGEGSLCNGREGKGRERKGREGNIYNVDCFKTLWDKYPRKEGYKEALKHFNVSVANDKDLENINTALNNYINHIIQNKIEKKYIKMGSTWFNNWQDWIQNPLSTRGVKENKESEIERIRAMAEAEASAGR